MLKSIDILIGFSVVMLVVSMSVTLIIQVILSFQGMRGKKLLLGVTRLLQTVDPKVLTPEWASQIARKVLTHPLLSRSGDQLAEVVHREELIKIVMEIAAEGAVSPPQPAVSAAAAGAGGGGVGLAPAAAPKPTTAEQALAIALANAGIPDPAGTLNAVRTLSMRLEAARPDLAAHVREATAVITEAESQFVAHINGWFDQSMDRVSQSYTKYSRAWTACISLLIAAALQLDSVALVNRLGMDDNLRNSLVQEATQITPPTAPTQGNPPPTDSSTLQNNVSANVNQLKMLATDSLITWPASPKEWWNAWGHVNALGILLSGVLLSFGAPFWFNVLGDLLKLRPVAAGQDDQQRQQRQVAQGAGDADGGSSPVTAGVVRASGERGNLANG